MIGRLGVMVSLVGVGCAAVTPKAAPTAGGERLLQLRDAMTGSFTTAEQAAFDDAYFEIELHVKPMWTWRDDGPWLYVEQAVANAPEAPYRQRVCKLERGMDGSLRSRVFVLDDPLEHAGAWRSGSPLSELSPSDLEERVGCAVSLRWDPKAEAFVGGTSGNGCVSDMNGAAFATSEVEIGDGRIVSWDRGYDATGQQVWGPETGGYEFVRVGE